MRMAVPGLCVVAASMLFAGEVRELRPTTAADIQASETNAAQEIVERTATMNAPIRYPQPLQARIEIPQADHAYRIIIDPVDRSVLSVEVESIRKTEAEIALASTNALAARGSARAAYSNSQAKARTSISGLNNNGVAGIRQALLDLQAQVDALNERMK